VVAEKTMVDSIQVTINKKEDSEVSLALFVLLVDLDDVHYLYTNAYIPEEFLGE
jgi:hypothetical protein